MKGYPENLMELARCWVRGRSGVAWTSPTPGELVTVLEAGATNEQWRVIVAANPDLWRGLYVHYLKSAAWARKREECMRRARDRCQRCIFTIAREVHHVSYARLGDEAPEDLEALCASCHRVEHGHEQQRALDARTLVFLRGERQWFDSEVPW